MQKTHPTTSGIVDIVLRYSDAFNKGNVYIVMAAITDDCIVDKPVPPPERAKFQDQDAVRPLRNDFFWSSPSIEFDTEDMFASDDRYLV